MSGFTDDSTIDDKEILWRNIPPNWVVQDKNKETMRPSSAAFKDAPDGSPMSVTLAAHAAELGWTPARQLQGLIGFSLSRISAGLARSCDQGVARDPDPPNLAHCVVFGKKTRSVWKRLAAGAEWVVPPLAMR